MDFNKIAEKGLSMEDRMKRYEFFETERTIHSEYPVIVRIDGWKFSTLTKNMARPHEPLMSGTMVETTRFIVGHMPLIGYTQSDEISLLWYPPDKLPFQGRIFKLQCVMASIASAKLNQVFEQEFEYNSLACFDARLFQVPSQGEAVNYFVWRELDAWRSLTKP